MAKNMAFLSFSFQAIKKLIKSSHKQISESISRFLCVVKAGTDNLFIANI